MIVFNVFSASKHIFEERPFKLIEPLTEKYRDEDLYVAPPFVDMHQHVNEGGGILSISADLAGLNKGVHLVIDAGSTGVNNYRAFRDHVVPSYKTPVKAFLNISAIGLASPQPYHDMRLCDPESVSEAIKEDGKRFLLGVKVLSSRVRVEDSLLEPIKLARIAADLAECPLMAHLAEGPPMNEDTLPFMKKGDIVTHCFHGNKYPLANPFFKESGEPIASLRDALDRGVLIDVGHGTSSMNASVARKAIAAGIKDFTISTDLHNLNVFGPVYGLPDTMSKFFDLGLDLNEIVDSVTFKAYKALRLNGCGQDLSKNATIFTLKEPNEGKENIADSEGNRIRIVKLIKPVAIIRNGVLIQL